MTRVSKRFFKIQTAWGSTRDDPLVLIYDKDREFFTEVGGKFALQLIDGLDMRVAADKLYVEGLVDKDSQLIVNKDTITREDRGW